MKKIILSILMCFALSAVHSQVGIGTTTPAPGSILDLTATNKALVVPRVASVAAVITPVNGMIVYDIAAACTRRFEKGVWSQCNGQITPIVATLDCINALTSGDLTSQVPASNVTVTLPYTGGNGGNYPGSILSSTGVTGLTAILVGGNFANGNGEVIYNIVGTPSAAGTASFAATLGGQSCSFSVVVNAATPQGTTVNCASPTVSGTLTANSSASSVFATLSYTGGNGSAYGSQILQSTGVNGLTAFLSAGTLSSGSGGTLTFSISGTPTANGAANFAFTFAGSTCTFSVNVNAPAVVSSFDNCSFATTGTFTQNTAASGTQTATYNGGSGASYPTTSFASAGVGGLTATIPAGILANGAGSLVLNITGTPTTFGTATFNITLLGASCSFSRTVNPATPICTVTIKDGPNPTDLITFMCHNLGVTDQSLDPASPSQATAGDYFQWGKKIAVATAYTSTAAIPGWSTTNAANGSWVDGSKTVNDPCPTGFRVPTKAQWDAVRNTSYNTRGTNLGAFTNSSANFGSAMVLNGNGQSLILPAAGSRSNSNGALANRGGFGFYWSSTESTSDISTSLVFGSSIVGTDTSSFRSFGFSVRCVSE